VLDVEPDIERQTLDARLLQGRSVNDRRVIVEGIRHRGIS
jgi:hypothetical protein